MSVKQLNQTNNRLTDESSIKSRALSAYFRSGGKDQPDHHMTQVYNVDLPTKTGETKPLSYIGLANVNGTLAVYRITNRGELKRLKRWPAPAGHA